MIDFEKHPCFSEGAKGEWARIHLPVAPECNVKCRFCERKFDCLNESRPGVTSSVLSPRQAAAYFNKCVASGMKVAVAGIAGPGDAFANWKETRETMEFVRKSHPETILCVSTNGVDLLEHVKELKDFNLSHVTVTVNALTAETASQVYDWARCRKRVYRGIEAGKVVAERQHAAIMALKEAGLTVKVNTILLPGVNDHEAIPIAREMASLGVDLHNIIPLLPVPGTPFESLPNISAERLASLRSEAGRHIRQMLHCSRCRADAAGLTGCDSDIAKRLMKEAVHESSATFGKLPYVAVATQEGLLVNMHLGEADRLWVFGLDDASFKCVGVRPAPEPGGGESRWMEMARTFSDCSAILVAGAGPSPTAALAGQGIKVVVMEGLIEQALEDLRSGRTLKSPVREFKCGDGCSGSGLGCSA